MRRSSPVSVRPRSAMNISASSGSIPAMSSSNFAATGSTAAPCSSAIFLRAAKFALVSRFIMPSSSRFAA